MRRSIGALFSFTLYSKVYHYFLSKKKGQIMASSFSYKTLARVRATQLHLKGIVTKDILTIFSQIDLISFKIQPCLKNTSYPKKGWIDFFFFLNNFNLWRPLLIITFYYHIKISIDFWYRRKLNIGSFIQPLNILPVELTRTHNCFFVINEIAVYKK